MRWLSKITSGPISLEPIETDLLGTVRDGFVAVDVETDGFDWWDSNRPFLVGIASSDGSMATIETDDEDGMREAKVILANPGLAKVGHNLKFDLHMLRAGGIEVKGPVVDTMLLTQLVDRGQNSYALKRLAANVLGEDTDEEDRLKKWMSKENRRRKKVAKKYQVPFVETTYKDVPMKLTKQYLRKDLEYTVKLMCVMGKRAADTCPDVTRKEMQLLRVVMDMERIGVPIDPEHFERQSLTAKVKAKKIEKKAYKLAGEEFNIGSGQQLSKILFGKLGFECVKWNNPTKRNPEGTPCLDADTLPMYDHPVVKAVLKYRKLAKLRSTYYHPLGERGSTGRIHPSFRQLGARTGRFSCAAPNLQNIPRKDKTVRAGFVCEPGSYMLLLDYSQIEMRIFAHYAESKTLIADLLAGTDLHTRTAIQLFGAEAKGNEYLRFVGKTINFGVIYGMGRRALRAQLRKRLLQELEFADTKPSDTVMALTRITETEAGRLLQQYYRSYPDVRKFMDKVQRDVVRQGELVDVFGRRYAIDARKAYKGVNFLVQGTAAGVLKAAMLRVHKLIQKSEKLVYNNERAQMVNCVHDELQIQIPTPVQPDTAVSLLKATMEDTETFSVPITVDISISTTNWAEKKEFIYGHDFFRA